MAVIIIVDKWCVVGHLQQLDHSLTRVCANKSELLRGDREFNSLLINVACDECGFSSALVAVTTKKGNSFNSSSEIKRQE